MTQPLSSGYLRRVSAAPFAAPQHNTTQHITSTLHENSLMVVFRAPPTILNDHTMQKVVGNAATAVQKDS
jgi:hypothetical protein